MCPFCYQTGGSLLHCLSTLTCHMTGGLFLLHFPWSHLHRTLSGILPCEARTFLVCSFSAFAAAITCLTCICALRTCFIITLVSQNHKYFLFCDPDIVYQFITISCRCSQLITSFILRMTIMPLHPVKHDLMLFLRF